jgi:hypothetical protein
MKPDQLLIFATSSALMEGSKGSHPSESHDVQEHLLDAYSASLYAREQALRKVSNTRRSAPRMIGLRFGTVVGVSRSQRLEMVHMALVRSAYVSKGLTVTHSESHRAMLWIDDLARAVAHVILRRDRVSARFQLFHLQSFATTVAAVANAVAAYTGARVFAKDHTGTDLPGFTLNASLFERTFDFHFHGTQDRVIQSLMEHAPSVMLGRELLMRDAQKPDSIPCVVCGSKDMMTVLDLGEQPLANEFLPNKADSLKCKKYPLKLMRCRKCHHAQLSEVVDREVLFSNYKYQSGTSKTLENYFAWLAEKIIKETKSSSGTVLEIACNDGSQLNQFKARGWYVGVIIW